MTDQIGATLVASGVALAVGLLGVGASLYGAYRARRTALDVQFSSEAAKALVRVIQLVETNGRAAQDRVFNLTRVGWAGVDPRTAEEGDPYGPQRRPHIGRNRTDEADISALIGAYGTVEMDEAMMDWLEALDAIERDIADADYDATENGKPPAAVDFVASTFQEAGARGALRVLIRGTVRVRR